MQPRTRRMQKTQSGQIEENKIRTQGRRETMGGKTFQIFNTRVKERDKLNIKGKQERVKRLRDTRRVLTWARSGVTQKFTNER